MKRYITVLAILLFAFSCQTNEEADQGPPIPVDELPTILADILTLEAAVKELPNASRDSLSTVYYNKALAPHGYEMDDFQQSMKWMQEDPERLQTTYEKALEILTKRETDLKGG